jgi:carboxylesterase
MAPRVLPWNAEIRLDGSAADSVMLLAGFGSGPETLRELAEHVRAATSGTVLVCSLARHTGNERAFHRSRSWHYFRDAERRFLEFWGEQGRPIHLGGYSTGALVALVVASRHPSKVAGLVMMSPALRVS